MMFMARKFRHICQQVRDIGKTKTKLVRNHRLARLIKDYNEVLTELMDINDFFKNFLGSFRFPTR